MTRSRTLTALLLVALTAVPVRPCGPDFPTAYVWLDSGDLLITMPEAHFYSELTFHLGTAGSDVPPEEFVDEQEAARLAEIDLLDKDAGQLANALRDQGVPEAHATELVWAYREARRVTRGLFYTKPQFSLASGWFGDGKWDPSQLEKNYTRQFDFDVYAPLFQKLPREFTLYAEGAALYHQGYMIEAIERWDALLALPEAERRYRSVWAASESGKARLILGDPGAIAAFEQVRALVDAGFPDPLGLYTTSLGWQARMEAQLGEYLPAIHHYAAQFRTGTQAERQTAHLSLDFICGALFRAGDALDAFLADAEAREIITLWVLSGRAEYPAGNTWTEALVANPPDGPIDAAGAMAHLYYQAGKWALANQWVAMADPADLSAQWVRAKLLLREGKLAEAETILASVNSALQGPSARAPVAVAANESLPVVVGSELGSVRLNKDDYPGAMLAFLRADSVDDANYIADQVMTLPELASFLEEHGAEFDLKPENAELWQLRSATESLRYILARRYARAGEFEKARDAYPPDTKTSSENEQHAGESLQTLIMAYADALNCGRDKAANRTERAAALMEAGKIARYAGLELFGTEQDPDWAAYDGVYEPWGETRAEAGTATPMEADRIARNAPTPNRRFHYRWVAADLMWEATQLLPDNDETTAQALWYGGTWIEKHDPEGADKFYKALVRRCVNLPIGKAADEKRWFPEKPTEWP
jgi:hypothetical protein